MAVGGPDSWTFEVDWTGTGVFVDESASVKAGTEVTVTRGRASEADDVQPGVLTLVLDNTSGRFTPDNPLSPLYPNVVDGRKTRFSVTRGASTSVRHRGSIVLGQPTGAADAAIVVVTSVDVLGRLSRQELRNDYLEKWIDRGQSQVVDLWPFEGVDLQNIGSGSGTARVVPTLTGVGAYGLANPDGVDLQSVISLTATKNYIGPVVQCDTSVPSGSVNNIMIPFRTSDRVPAGSQSKYLAVGLDAAGAKVWSVQLVDVGGRTDVAFLDAAGTTTTTLYQGFSPVGADTGDDQWFVLTLLNTGGTQFVVLKRVIDNVSMGTFAGVQDCRTTQTVIAGGYIGGRRTPGKQIACCSVQFGGIVISDDTVGGGGDNYLRPSSTTDANTRYAELNLYGNFASSTTGTTNKTVARRSLAGRKVFEVLAEIARTVGGVFVASRATDDTVLFYQPDTQRLPTLALPVDIELDADGSTQLPMVKGGSPSRVTATWPQGQVTVEDTTRALVSQSVDTAAADVNGARDVASALVYVSNRLRLEKLGVDIASASNDLWASIMALEVGARLRAALGTAGTPLVSQYGVTYLDVYAPGWVERYALGVAEWVFDTIPADDPVEAVTDDTDYGRAAADSQTAAPGTATGTATGTVVVTTVSGLPLSTAAGDYPQYFSWNGERVRVPSPPASGSSPQTVTVDQRGVAPSVARSHASGEPWDVWFPAAAAR